MKQNRWDDHYARRAKKEKWLARSVYKLQEIDNKFKLIHKGNRLLDLGCYPGSWTQYALKKVGNQGEVVGIDLSKPEHLLSNGFRFIQADVMRLEPQWLTLEISPRDVVISDLASANHGDTVHRYKSFHLSRKESPGNFQCTSQEKGKLCM